MLRGPPRRHGAALPARSSDRRAGPRPTASSIRWCRRRASRARRRGNRPLGPRPATRLPTERPIALADRAAAPVGRGWPVRPRAAEGRRAPPAGRRRSRRSSGPGRRPHGVRCRAGVPLYLNSPSGRRAIRASGLSFAARSSGHRRRRRAASARSASWAGSARPSRWHSRTRAEARATRQPFRAAPGRGWEIVRCRVVNALGRVRTGPRQIHQGAKVREDRPIRGPFPPPRRGSGKIVIAGIMRPAHPIRSTPRLFRKLPGWHSLTSASQCGDVNFCRIVG